MIRAALALALMASPALAQDFPPPAPQGGGKCDKRLALIYRLANQFLEAQIAVWLAPDGSLMELWGNPKTGTSTVIRTQPGKDTCMIDSGEGFQMFRYLPGEDA
jgi:hypothetical protein